MTNELSNQEKLNNYVAKKNAVLAIIAYVFIFFLGSSLILIALMMIYSNTHENIDYETLFECATATDLTKYSDDYKSAVGLLSGMANFLTYAIIFIIMVILLKKVFFDDYIKLTKRPKFYLIFIPVALAIFYALTLMIDGLVYQYSPSTDNQATIELILTTDGKIYAILFVSFLAPVVEELIYRYSIFKLTKNIHVVLSYVLSIVAFTLPHVLSTDINSVGVATWFIQTIPYAVSGLLFAIMYQASGYNIYVTILAHMLNNTLAVFKILS